jgi:hypothetical protein
MGKIGEILYFHVKRRTRRGLEPGRWFFHTDRLALCGELGKIKKNEWNLHIYYLPYGKSLPEDLVIKRQHRDVVVVGSEEEALKFMSEFFAVPVVKAQPKHFPDPDS